MDTPLDTCHIDMRKLFKVSKLSGSAPSQIQRRVVLCPTPRVHRAHTTHLDLHAVPGSQRPKLREAPSLCAGTDHRWGGVRQPAPSLAVLQVFRPYEPELVEIGHPFRQDSVQLLVDNGNASCGQSDLGAPSGGVRCSSRCAGVRGPVDVEGIVRTVFGVGYTLDTPYRANPKDSRNPNFCVGCFELIISKTTASKFGKNISLLQFFCAEPIFAYGVTTKIIIFFAIFFCVLGIGVDSFCCYCQCQLHDFGPAAEKIGYGTPK